MIRLGLRLTLGAGREAAARLVIIAAAVAVGVTLLLGTLAAVNATKTQNERFAWLNTGSGSARQLARDTKLDPLWWLARLDRVHGKDLARIDVAGTGADSPVPPGLPRLPGPGEYYASPAVAKLLTTLPADQLADRFPGHQVGTIGSAGLPGPDSLIVVVGHTPAELSAAPDARRTNWIMDVSPSSCDDCVVGTNANGMRLILSVSAVGLILPVLILIGTATRLAAARREQRFAAMRLVGATPRQISVVSAVESTVAAVLGVLGGFLFFLVGRPLLATVDFTATPFFDSDLALNTTDVLLVALGVPLASAVAARLALRRVQISPLGVTRRVTPKPPRAWRLLPLLAGVLELGYFVGRRPATTQGQMYAFTPGMALVVIGLAVAGPYLTMVGARQLARRSGRAAPLMAGRRLSDDPKAGFRAVTGLVLALCVTTGAVAIMTSIQAERGMPKAASALASAVTVQFSDGLDDQGAPLRAAPAMPADAYARLRAIPGVQGVTVIHTNPLHTRDPLQTDGPGERFVEGGLASCAQLATTPAFSTCVPGADTATVPLQFWSFKLLNGGWPAQWQRADYPAAQLDGLPVLGLAVTTDGTPSAIERVRTALEQDYPGHGAPATVAERAADGTREVAGFQQLADIVILVSLPIAGCSLAVGIAGGLNERKRPFSLLRLAGVPLGLLRRIVLLESALPLVLVAALAVGMGLLAAQLFLRAQLGYNLHALDGSFYLIVAAGLVAALAVIAATLPLLKRLTGPETARNE
ncbi:FtsX-like permease family protein [Kitasatospora sp. NPDC058965]|uniref:FtsX-like permease family protein n=1 Tax=Kitasatospora sp. NPDC058965 TaxID=3346682 RepID=UPI0036A6A673